MSEAEFEKVLQLKDEEIATKQSTNSEQERRIAEANATLQKVEAKTAELSAAMARDAPVEELAALHRELDRARVANRRKTCRRTSRRRRERRGVRVRG